MGGVLHQLSSVYRHFILNKGVVVRDRFDKRYTKSYYLCAVVLFDVSKHPDIVHRHELSSEEWSISIRRMEATRKRGSSVESQLNSKNAGTYVDSNSLLPKSARSTDAMYIVFTISAYEVWVK
jgi:hypothetical protein